VFCQTLVAWYNDEHYHSGLGLHTAADVHYGTAQAVRDKRCAVLAAAHTAHPARFVRKLPEPPKLPTASWINPPEPPEEATQ
jgi:putative transposase